MVHPKRLILDLTPYILDSIAYTLQPTTYTLLNPTAYNLRRQASPLTF